MLRKFNSIFLWLIVVFFFAYQFILRNSPGILFDELISKFDINASEFALFSSVFYIAYAIMQIPTGIILDKFRLNYCLPILIIIFLLGCFLFSHTENYYLALLARMMMGIGATAGFLGTTKVVSLYFPEKMYSFMVSLTFTFGFLGAIYGGRPTTILFQLYGWEKVFDILIFIGLLISISIFLFLKRRVVNIGSDKALSIRKSIREIIKQKEVIIISMFGGFMIGSTEGFADAWGVKYLVVNYGFIKEDASLISSMVYLGLCIGGPILVWFSAKYTDDYKTVFLSGIIMFVCFLLLILPIDLSFWAVFIIVFIIGICSGSQVLIFSINNRMVDKNLSGITAAITNSIVMSFGFIIHQIIGLIIDTVGKLHKAEGKAVLVDVNSFKYGLFTIAIFGMIGSIGIILYRKNYRVLHDEVKI